MIIKRILKGTFEIPEGNNEVLIICNLNNKYKQTCDKSCRKYEVSE